MSKEVSRTTIKSLHLSIVKAPGVKWILLLLPLFYVLIFMYYPLTDFFKLSLFDDSGFTLQYVTKALTSPLYLKVIWTTIKIPILVTFFSILIAYPVAYYITNIKSKFYKSIILGSVLLVFLLSMIIRTFAWTILLQNNGVINSLLMTFGIIDNPLQILHTTTAAIIGMTYILLPYMILNLYAVMIGIDKRLVDAAKGLGAKPMRAFIQIFFPLSIPGLISGSILVFILGLGFYIAPALLGGHESMMLSSLVAHNINQTMNWHMASALSLVLFLITLIILLVSYLLVRKNPVFKGVI